MIKFLCTTMFLALIFMVSTAGLALAWEEPSHWSSVGTVNQWMKYDQHFYRSVTFGLTGNTAIFDYDQKSIYQETLLYRNELPPINLADFLNLTSDEQEKRIKEAKKHLRLPARFLDRINGQVQRTSEGQSSNWGLTVGDETAIGECLQSLTSAVALDPSNPYALHLLAYFTAAIGDIDRSGQAISAAELALVEIPQQELTKMRRRLALDKAWLARNLGHYSNAQKAIDQALEFGKKTVETEFLQALVAVGLKNNDQALKIAENLRSVEVRQYAWLKRTPKQGGPDDEFGLEILDPNQWNVGKSDYIHKLINAMVWINEGNLELAKSVFREYPYEDIYPHARYFWQEAGTVYSMTGRTKLADEAWGNSRALVPYQPYFLYKPYSLKLSKLGAGRQRTSFHLGYDDFFMAGDRLAYSAHLMNQAGNQPDTYLKQELISAALDELEICKRLRFSSHTAQYAEAMIYTFMKDHSSAIKSMEELIVVLGESGNATALTKAQITLDILKQNQELIALNLSMNQTGTLSGHSMPTQNVEADLESYRKDWKDNPSDETRRSLARLLIRSSNAEEGYALAIKSLGSGQHQTDQWLSLPEQDLILALEAEHRLGKSACAYALATGLKNGQAENLENAALWVLVGTICLTEGQGQVAQDTFARALSLDPDNQSIKNQLRMMEQVAQ